MSSELSRVCLMSSHKCTIIPVVTIKVNKSTLKTEMDPLCRSIILGGDALQLWSKGRYGSCVGGRYMYM